MTLTKEQIEAIRARAETEWGFAARNIPALCQMALRAIELEDENADLELHLSRALGNPEIASFKEENDRLQSELAATRNALEERTEQCAKVCDAEGEHAMKKANVNKAEGDEAGAFIDLNLSKLCKWLGNAIRTLPSPQVKT